MSLIYIVEDDTNIREIETFALKSSGHTIVAIESSKYLYRKMEERRPDLLLLDVMLPDEDGYSIVSKIRSNSLTRAIPIIMVTAMDSELDMIRGLDLGADDYIKKPFSVMELITRVKTLLRRTTSESSSSILSLGSLCMDGERHVVYVNEEACTLTYKEYELLHLFLENTGVVLSRDVIMERVWGTAFEGESRTVDMHIKTLRHKLGEAGSRIRTIRNVGYIIE